MGNHIYIPKPATSGIYYPEYGLLYNGYIISDSRKLFSSDDWDFPTQAQCNSLITYAGGTTAGKKLKLPDLTYWASVPTGTDNSLFLRLIGNGLRSTTGIFQNIKYDSRTWTKTLPYSGVYYHVYNLHSQSNLIVSVNAFKNGFSIRGVKLATGVPDGTITNYTGNDGKVYLAVAINQIYWIQYNLAETRFRNGDIIPWYGADPANFFTNAEWAALTTAGCCAYNNTLSNVGPGFSFPT